MKGGWQEGVEGGWQEGVEEWREVGRKDWSRWNHLDVTQRPDCHNGTIAIMEQPILSCSFLQPALVFVCCSSY